MSASDHLHPYQMKLFMTARELMGMTAGHTEIGANDYRPFVDSPSLRATKLAEAKSGSASSTFFPKKRGKDSLYDSIKKEGVTSPVSIWAYKDDGWKEIINNGHHRIAAAYDINPEMYIPVEYR